VSGVDGYLHGRVLGYLDAADLRVLDAPAADYGGGGVAPQPLVDAAVEVVEIVNLVGVYVAPCEGGVDLLDGGLEDDGILGDGG